MGSSEGEAIAAPDAGGAGGSRAFQGGDAGCAMEMAPRARCYRSRSGRVRRERQLESVRLIGQGSDALVYLVRCEVTGRRSALKVRLYSVTLYQVLCTGTNVVLSFLVREETLEEMAFALRK